METPKLSWKTITYGRVALLEESLYSFLTQEYEGKREMIIVNDYPLQKLVFDHPLVKIINLDTPFDILGEKENFAVEQCTGDIIIVGDDDDVAMPNHFSNIEKYFVEGTDLLHWHRGVLYNTPEIAAITGLGNSGIVYSKAMWEKVKYPSENAGYDTTFVYNIKLQPGAKVVYAAPPDNEVSWFYMWGNRCFHGSGAGTDTPDRPSAFQRHSAYIESERKAGRIPTGEVILQPRWHRDYKQMLNDYVRKNQGFHNK